MKFIKLILILSLFVTVNYGQIDSKAESRNFDQSEIKISGKLHKISKKILEFEYTLENSSNRDIYFAYSPFQTNDKQGYYFEFDKEKSTLRVSSRVFHSSVFYSPPSNHTKVLLKKLNTQESFSEKISLTFPLKETIPPNENPYKLEKVFQDKIMKIELNFGYFIENDELRDFLKTKTHGWYVNDSQILFSGNYKGKPLIENQKIVSTDIQLPKKK